MQQNHSIELVLFDLDGTLVDTAPDFILSLNNILISNGKEAINDNLIRSYVSDGSAKLIELGFEITNDHPNFTKYRNELLTEYKKNLVNESKLFDGINEVILHLNNINIPFGIVTNKPYKYAEPVVKNFEILNHSKILVCPDHIQNAKPDPEGILLACSKLNIKSENCVYIGDHQKDIQAGINAGSKTIGCLYGYSLDSKDDYGETILIKEPKEIIKLIN